MRLDHGSWWRRQIRPLFGNRQTRCLGVGIHRYGFSRCRIKNRPHYIEGQAKWLFCIAPLTDKRIELSGEEIEDVSGYFLYETKGGSEPGEVRIIARLTSEEAALRLKNMLALK